MICMKDKHKLYRPYNEWDMNYHLIDDKGNEYLIDIDDVTDDITDIENEYSIILWEDFSTLSDIDTIKEYAWKIIPSDDREPTVQELMAKLCGY